MLFAAVLNGGPGHGMATSWVEVAGILAFGVYGFVKGLELKHTGADRQAAAGKLRLRSGVVEEIRPLVEEKTNVRHATG